MAKQDFGESLGRAARDARKARGFTQADVAEQLGVSTEFYARIERGVALPSVPTLSRLAPILGTTCDVLLGLSAEKGTALPRESGGSPDYKRVERKIRTSSPRVLRALLVLLDEVSAKAPASKRRTR